MLHNLYIPGNRFLMTSHFRLYLIFKGRTSWYNTNQKNEEAEEEEEEEQDVADDVEPEIGPSLLTSIAEDIEVDNMPAWTARVSSNVIHPNHSLGRFLSCTLIGLTQHPIKIVLSCSQIKSLGWSNNIL